MAEKKHMKSEEFWGNVTKMVGDFEQGNDEVAVFLSHLSEVKDEPTHEV